MEPEPYTRLSFYLPTFMSQDIIYYVFGGTIMLLLLFASLICSFEVAFFSLTSADLQILKKSKTRVNRIVLQFIESPGRILATTFVLRICINMILVLLSTLLAVDLAAKLRISWLIFVYEILLLTLLLLFFEARIPNRYAGNRAISMVRFFAMPIILLEYFFRPINYLLIFSNTSFSDKIVQFKYRLSLDELSALLAKTTTDNREISLLKGVIRFEDTDVKEIMKSRVDVLAVDVAWNFDKMINQVIEWGYSRLPVYDGSLDNIKGVLYLKDLLHYMQKSSRSEWQSLIRPPFIVPETRKINDMLKDMQKNKIHMAIIIDEYGGTSGIVTLEDILEEIVGDIRDESDEEEALYSKIDEHNYLFEGKMLLNDVIKILGIREDTFDDIQGDSDTLAGLILDIKGEMPAKTEVITYKNFIFTIESVDKRRIRQIKCTIVSKSNDESESSEA